MNKIEKNKKKLVACYGSLRKGLHNHNYHLENAEYLGDFKTNPEFTMYSLGSFPGIKMNGDTSLKMEVYRVTKLEGLRIDALEGYSESSYASFYDRITIETPFGPAHTYIYMGNTDHCDKVESGDWKEFKSKSYYSVTQN